MSTLRFFDANSMIGTLTRPEPSGHPDTVKKLEAELEYFGIADAVVCHARAVERNLDIGNQTIVEELAGHDTLHPAWVIPMHTAIDYPEPERFVDEMLASGVRAVRVWPPPYHGYLADPWALGPLWHALAERRVPVLVSASDLGRYPDQPGQGFSARNLYDICRAHPTLPVVVVRLNFSALRVGVPLLRECPNLFAELSFFTTHRGVEFLCGEVGAERLLYGSGLPFGSPGPGITGIQYALISDEERALVAGDNLRALLAHVDRASASLPTTASVAHEATP
jgi:hypothetical protein